MEIKSLLLEPYEIRPFLEGKEVAIDAMLTAQITKVLTAGYIKLEEVFDCVTVVPLSLPGTVWFSTSYDTYKRLFPDGKLMR